MVATSGLDNLHAGSQTVISGSPTKTMGAAGLEALGVPPEYSEIAYATVGLGGATTIVLKSPSGKLVQVMVSGENKVAKTTIDSLPSSQPNHSVAGKGTGVDKLAKNGEGFKEISINKTPLEGHDRLNTIDKAGNNKLNPAEAATAARLEIVLGKMERVPVSPIREKTADFIILSGPNKGKTVDLMYTTKNLSQTEIDMMNKHFEYNMTVSKKPGRSPSGKKQISEHLSKADIVPVDFTMLTLKNQKLFTDYVKTLPKSQQDKIIIMR